MSDLDFTFSPAQLAGLEATAEVEPLVASGTADLLPPVQSQGQHNAQEAVLPPEDSDCDAAPEGSAVLNDLVSAALEGSALSPRLQSQTGRQDLECPPGQAAVPESGDLVQQLAAFKLRAAALEATAEPEVSGSPPLDTADIPADRQGLQEGMKQEQDDSGCRPLDTAQILGDAQALQDSMRQEQALQEGCPPPEQLEDIDATRETAFATADSGCNKEPNTSELCSSLGQLQGLDETGEVGLSAPASFSSYRVKDSNVDLDETCGSTAAQLGLDETSEVLPQIETHHDETCSGSAQLNGQPQGGSFTASVDCSTSAPTSGSFTASVDCSTSALGEDAIESSASQAGLPAARSLGAVETSKPVTKIAGSSGRFEQSGPASGTLGTPLPTLDETCESVFPSIGGNCSLGNKKKDLLSLSSHRLDETMASNDSGYSVHTEEVEPMRSEYLSHPQDGIESSAGSTSTYNAPFSARLDETMASTEEEEPSVSGYVSHAAHPQAMTNTAMTDTAMTIDIEASAWSSMLETGQSNAEPIDPSVVAQQAHDTKATTPPPSGMLSEQDLAALVLAQVREDTTKPAAKAGMPKLQLAVREVPNSHHETPDAGGASPSFGPSLVPKLSSMPNVDKPSGIKNTARISLDTEQVDLEAFALMEMGLKERECIDILKEGASIEEAANRLLDQRHPPPSTLDAVGDYLSQSMLGACTTRSRPDVYRPGTYVFVEVGAPTGLKPTASARDGFKQAEKSSDKHDGKSEDRIAVGSAVEFVEIEVDHVQHLVLGRLQDGRWIGIASTNEDEEAWAEPMPVQHQLIQLGFSSEQAYEAGKRCSTVGGALEFLEGTRE